MSASHAFSMALLLYASTSFATGARISLAASRASSQTGVGCSKVQASYTCRNLISWHENTINDVFFAEKSPLNMGEQDGVKCAAALLLKYPGKVDVCKQALELLIDNKHITEKDLDGLPELKERAQQVALSTPINVDFANDAEISVPRCNSGEVSLTFHTVRVFGWVRTDDRTVGAETEVECGSKARDPSAKIGLICTAQEDASQPPVWRIKSGECTAPTPACPEQRYSVTFTMKREGEAAKDTQLTFKLPRQENPGIKNIDYPVDCTEGTLLTKYNAREVTGGQVNFECTTEGRWIIGKKDAQCTWADDEPTLPHGQEYVGDSTEEDVASMGPGACEAVRMKFMYADGTPVDFSVHELPPAPANKKVERSCSKSGWTGTVTYQCQDGEWDSVEEPGLPSCYRPDTCVGTSKIMRISGDFVAEAKFTLDDTALGRRKELACSSADIQPSMTLKGNTIFECTTGSNGRPTWEKISSDCRKDIPVPAKPANTGPAKPQVTGSGGADMGPGSCKGIRMRFKPHGGSDADVITHMLPPTTNTGEVTLPCDAPGWTGEVVYICKDGSFDSVKVPGKPACYRPDRCVAGGMRLALGGSVNAQLSFQLPETMLDESTPDLSCASATTETALKGTASFKCVAGEDERPTWATGATSCTAA